MAATVTQNGQTLIIVGTTGDVLQALVDYRYPVAKAMAVSGTTYYILASYQN